jgi:hypothetical protein
MAIFPPSSTARQLNIKCDSLFNLSNATFRYPVYSSFLGVFNFATVFNLLTRLFLLNDSNYAGVQMLIQVLGIGEGGFTNRTITSRFSTLVEGFPRRTIE